MLRKHSNPRCGHAANRDDGLDVELDEVVVDHDTEEPQENNQLASFHQSMKLSELAQRYLKHQPARLAPTIHQQ